MVVVKLKILQEAIIVASINCSGWRNIEKTTDLLGKLGPYIEDS
jgi:hypothetical protein